MIEEEPVVPPPVVLPEPVVLPDPVVLPEPVVLPAVVLVVLPPAVARNRGILALVGLGKEHPPPPEPKLKINPADVLGDLVSDNNCSFWRCCWTVYIPSYSFRYGWCIYLALYRC